MNILDDMGVSKLSTIYLFILKVNYSFKGQRHSLIARLACQGMPLMWLSVSV